MDTSPRGWLVRHAESVAQIVRHDEYAGRFVAGQTTYLFVDDAGRPPSERLRDPVLSGPGVDHARCVGEHLPPEHSAAYEGVLMNAAELVFHPVCAERYEVDEDAARALERRICDTVLADTRTIRADVTIENLCHDDRPGW